MSEASRAWTRRLSRIGFPALAAATPMTTLVFGGAAIALFGNLAGVEAMLLLLPAFVLPGLVALGMMHRVSAAPAGARRILLVAALALGAVSGVAFMLQEAADPAAWVLPGALMGTLYGGLMALPALPLLFPARHAPQGALRIVVGAILGVAALLIAWVGIIFQSGETPTALTGFAILGGAVLLSLASLSFVLDGVAARGSTADPAIEREIDGGRRALDDAFVGRAMDERERASALLRVDRLQARAKAAISDARMADATGTIARVLVVCAFLLATLAVLTLTLIGFRGPEHADDEWFMLTVAPATTVFAGYALGCALVLGVSGITGRLAASLRRGEAEAELRSVDAAAKALREEALYASRDAGRGAPTRSA